MIGNQRLLAPVEDVLAEGEVSIQEESGEDVADLKHANSPSQRLPTPLSDTESIIFPIDRGANSAS